MDRILDLFPSLARSPVYAEVLNELMQSFDEHQAFSTREPLAVQPFISHTNNQLNDPAHRLKGLVLLNIFLPQCSDQQFLDHGISWMSQCVRGVESTMCTETNETAYRVLTTLLEMSGKFNELNKSVNHSIIVKFSENLKRPGMKMEVQVAALDCIRVMVTNYGAACGSQWPNIEQFVLGFADCKDEYAVSVAARCFAALPLVGSSGTSVLHKARWLERQRKTCYSLRLLLDQLLENVDEADVYARGENAEKLPLELLTSGDPVLRVYEIANRFNNLTVFLAAMLTGAFPAAKSVLPELIIGTAARGLAVTCSALGTEPTNELLALSAVIPSLHVSLLHLLRALVLCCGRNLYPLGKSLCKLAVQSLEWTSASASGRCGTTRRYGKVRVAACSLLARWLATAGGGSGIESRADALVAALAADVAVGRDTVRLAVHSRKKSGQKRKNPSPAATAAPAPRARLGAAVTAASASNAEPCAAALDALRWLLHAAAARLEPALHRTVQSTALAAALEVQRSAGDEPAPYDRPACRIALYRLAAAAVACPSARWPPPTQHVATVLARGMADRDGQVAEYCVLALAQVEKLVHPAARTLEFPVSLEEMLRGAELKAPRRPQVQPTPTPTKRSVTFQVAERAEMDPGLDGDECIDLSSGSDNDDANDVSAGDFAGSNASVISSNSNYQDLVLMDAVDDDKVVESTSPQKVVRPTLALRSDIEQIDLDSADDDDDDVGIVTSTSPARGVGGASVGGANGEPRRGASPRKAAATTVAVQTPVVVLLDEKPVESQETTVSNGSTSLQPTEVSKEPIVTQASRSLTDLNSFKGLTDDEVVNLVASDCLFFGDD